MMRSRPDLFIFPASGALFMSDKALDSALNYKMKTGAVDEKEDIILRDSDYLRQ